MLCRSKTTVFRSAATPKRDGVLLSRWEGSAEGILAGILADMALGQQSGPPARHRQVQTLLELLDSAGYSDFRDARGAMGFTQRQAGGKFTSDEAEAFIDQLEEAAHNGTPTVAQAASPTQKTTPADKALEKLSDQRLATELQRRGWIVMEP